MKIPARLRPRLTYANVVATVCLFLLLGSGAAFAASQLPKNSVGAKQLKKQAVTPAKMARSTLARLKGAAGPAGPTGPAGPKGDAGPAGRDAGPAYFGLSEKGGFEFPQGEEQEVIGLRLKNLPAGSYTLSFDASLISDNEQKTSIDCGFVPEGPEPTEFATDLGLYAVPAVAPGSRYTTPVSLQTGVVYGQDGGEIGVACEAIDGEIEEAQSGGGRSAIDLVFPNLVATKVTSLTIQESPSEVVAGVSKARLRRLEQGG